MSTTTPIQPPRAITSRAAENGLVISGCICLLLLFCGLATVQPVACLLLWAGTLAMPVVIYRLLARSYRQGRCTFGFAEIWAEGIASFFLGSLVPAAVAYLLLRFAFSRLYRHPNGIDDRGIQVARHPEGDQWAKTLTDIRAKAPSLRQQT